MEKFQEILKKEIEFLNGFPKSKEKLTIWSKNLFSTIGFDIENGFVDTEFLAFALANVRNLYGFFDSNDFIVGIYPNQQGEWILDIPEKGYSLSLDGKTREEAEKEAFKEVFKQFEMKI